MVRRFFQPTDDNELFNDSQNRLSNERIIELFERFYASSLMFSLEDIDEDNLQVRIANIVHAMKKDHYLIGIHKYHDLYLNSDDINNTEKIDILANIFRERPANEAEVHKILEKIRTYFLELFGNPIVSINHPEELFVVLLFLAGINNANIGYENDGIYTWTLDELRNFERVWQNKVDDGFYRRLVRARELARTVVTPVEVRL
tara:strand:+ start:77 stop:685 length:609 start_codon:yes stop_codon:yes gene_type:complete